MKIYICAIYPLKAMKLELAPSVEMGRCWKRGRQENTLILSDSASPWDRAHASIEGVATRGDGLWREWPLQRLDAIYNISTETWLFSPFTYLTIYLQKYLRCWFSPSIWNSIVFHSNSVIGKVNELSRLSPVPGLMLLFLRFQYLRHDIV